MQPHHCSSDCWDSRGDCRAGFTLPSGETDQDWASLLSLLVYWVLQQHRGKVPAPAGGEGQSQVQALNCSFDFLTSSKRFRRGDRMFVSGASQRVGEESAASLN